MRKALLVLGASMLGLTAVGCGPLHSPMPPRLNEEDQKSAEKAWNDAFTPVDRVDHQTMLDAFLVSQAYQVGVDRLTMRSEKKLNQGMLVMEIHFDRAKPDDDRFEVGVYDKTGQQTRRDVYTRADVERTNGELFPAIPQEGTVQPEPVEWAQKRAAAKKRLEAVEKLLPKSEPKKEPENKQPLVNKA